jgi:hypothetical protein
MQALVDGTRASRDARERTKVILLTLARESSVQTGYERLGMGRTRFQDLRRRMIEGAVQALEERPAGRPRRRRERDGSELQELRGRLVELELELLRTRAELDVARSGAAAAVEVRLAAKGVRR